MDEYCLGTQPPTIPFKSTSSHCCLSLNSHVLTGLWTYVQSSPESGALGCLFFFFFYNLHKNIGKCYGKCKFLIVLRKKNPQIICIGSFFKKSHFIPIMKSMILVIVSCRCTININHKSTKHR